VQEVAAFPEARTPALKLVVDFGPAVGSLATSAQITSYSEAELVGRLVVGAINLGVKRVAGFRSEFLILGVIHGDGTVSLLEPGEGARPGDRVA
jgi:tRNA-binding protein